MMRKIIRKCFFAWDYDKEEIWLNEMASKGLILVAVGYCKYTFEECTPGKYHVRFELLENLPSHAESQQYIKFIEETGAQYLGSVMRWVYFRSTADHGEFHLYSDNQSRIKHLNRLLALIGVASIVIIYTGLINATAYFVNGVIANLIIGIINLSIGIFFARGFFKIHCKKRELIKERNLFE